MMDATDAWPAVRHARQWVLDAVRTGPGDRVVDVGSGPGTFTARVATDGAWTLDVDRSLGMLGEGRTRAGGAALCADIAALPLRTASARLVRAERVLQWTPDPDAGLAELLRIAAADGAIAVTDTDWTSFRVDHDDPDLAARWAAAAVGWVPHARLAASLVDRLAPRTTGDLRTRRDTVVLTDWPSGPGHGDGPPGLPLTSIAAGAPTPTDRATLEADVATLAARARAGRFRATLDLVTVLGGAPDPASIR